MTRQSKEGRHDGSGRLASTSIAVGALGLALFACNQSNGRADGGIGGHARDTGGSNVSGTGGRSAPAGTGGSPSSGGMIGSGGSNGSGGVMGGGGASSVGGASSAGGSGQTGGMGATGGTAGSSGGTAGAGSGGPAGTGGSATGGAISGGSSGKGGMGSGGMGSGGNGSGGSGSGGGSGGSTATCPTVSLQPGDSNKTLSVAGTSRTYILHVPSKYDGTSAVPLILDFHGIGGSGAAQEASTQYKAVTDPEGVITVYPDGKPGPQGNAWNVGPCCVANVDDIAFAKALVSEVEKVACIDSKRVYAIGYSMGGGMSHYIGCHAGDVFAAVAPAAFDLLKENQDGCTPSRPIPILIFRSTNDGVVPYNGGFSSYVPGMSINFLGAKATFQTWAQIDQCTGSPSAEDGNGCSTYSSCGGGVQVTLCTKQGGGHDEGNGSIGWPFLKKYTLP
jgi:polyhydroxybutyrate depolymerase